MLYACCYIRVSRLICFKLFDFIVFFFFKQKTAYEMRISDWSSDVCSSDLRRGGEQFLCSCQAFMPAQISKGACRLGNNVTRNEHMRREIGRASCRERVCQYV